MLSFILSAIPNLTIYGMKCEVLSFIAPTPALPRQSLRSFSGEGGLGSCPSGHCPAPELPPGNGGMTEETAASRMQLWAGFMVMCRMNSVLEAQAPSFGSSPAPRRAGEEVRKVIGWHCPPPSSPRFGCASQGEAICVCLARRIIDPA